MLGLALFPSAQVQLGVCPAGCPSSQEVELALVFKGWPVDDLAEAVVLIHWVSEMRCSISL